MPVRKKTQIAQKQYPVLPLRNIVMTPYQLVPLLVGRKGSIEAVEKAFIGDKKIICTAQSFDLNDDEMPDIRDLYNYGTLCTIVEIFRLPDDNIRVLVEGLSRVFISNMKKTKSIIKAYATPVEHKIKESLSLNNEALFRTLKKLAQEYISLNKNIPDDPPSLFIDIAPPLELFYYIFGKIEADVASKQNIYEKDSIEDALQETIALLSNEIEILKLENKIDDKVKKKLTKLQRDYYLSEQLKIIQRELGIGSDEKEDLFDLKKKIEKLNLSDEARKKANEEINKLGRLTHMSQEYSVIHTYLRWILDLPWSEPIRNDSVNLADAEDILNRDHYGLQKVKERILEYLAVTIIADKMKGQILCFVGPPGVGKTSLGKSIAEATGRKFVRMSLGGVRDEAEIRGHRRTYVAAMPGTIIQSMKKAGTKNPLIMMDEIDKLSRDFRGDPTSALLEVLDPEQNSTFRDHYLDFDYDLSQVMFITTANSLSSIPQPLVDRMEIIRLPGYTMFDKYHIARKHLIPKLVTEYQISDKITVNFSKDAVENIIGSYTREAGVRNLERTLSKVIRKIIKEFVMKSEAISDDAETGKRKSKRKVKKFEITPDNIPKYLGPAHQLYSEVNRSDSIGIVTGLAWTPYGGETLQIEAVKMTGTGDIKLTGKLGDTMKESAQAALSYCRYLSKKFDIDANFYRKTDIHLHIPEGAIPKDGPSAGAAIVTAFVSILANKKVKANLAMTGEITLSGKILPIGGLEEKIIAAKRSNIKTVLIPHKNEPELSEITGEIKKGIKIILVRNIEEVLSYALV